MTPSLAFVLVWLGWAVSWFAAARWSAPIEKRARGGTVWLCRFLVVVGALLMSRTMARVFGAERLWHVARGDAYALVALTLAGILFAWWARIHLGRLWSGAVTRKVGHRVIDTGPYRWVRHPIYTGLIFAALMTAVAKATVPALLGFLCATLGVWLKARLEERFLGAELGAEYDAYRRRVPMLVPLLPAG